MDKIEVEAEAPPLPEPPADTGEICFDIVDNNNSLVYIYLYDADS